MLGAFAPPDKQTDRIDTYDSFAKKHVQPEPRDTTCNDKQKAAHWRTRETIFTSNTPPRESSQNLGCKAAPWHMLIMSLNKFRCVSILLFHTFFTTAHRVARCSCFFLGFTIDPDSRVSMVPRVSARSFSSNFRAPKEVSLSCARHSPLSRASTNRSKETSASLLRLWYHTRR